MAKKIVIIHLNPLLKRLKSAFLIEPYLDSGFDVEYWDLSPFYNRSVKFPDELLEPYVFKFNSLGEVEKRLAGIDKKKAVFIVQIPEIWHFRLFFRMLAGYKCYIANINLYSPSVYAPSFRELARDLAGKELLYHVLRWGVVKAYFYYKKLYNYKTFHHYFAVSDPKINSMNHPFYGVNINQPARETSINLSDYEIFQDIKNDTARIIENKYIIFIDQYFPLHAELVHRSRQSPVIAKAYHRSMRTFFDWLENQFQMPVVIAAHPSAVYENNELGDRQILKNKTAELARDAEMVVAHYSTSNVYAILFDKPLVFVKTNNMNLYIYRFLANKISGLAGFFNKEAYNIDQCPYEKIEFSKTEKSLREKYIYTYVTSPEAENKKNKEIVINEFNRVFDMLESF